MKTSAVGLMFQKGNPYFEHKAFFGIQEDDTPAWEQLFQAAEAFGKKYAVTPEKQFAQNLILLVVNEIEQKAKGGTDNATKK